MREARPKWDRLLIFGHGRVTVCPMADNSPVLYVKTGCPWCAEVTAFLQEKSIAYDEKNVSQDPQVFTEMEQLSGQTKAPVLNWHGKILADFGVDELKPFLTEQKVEL